MKTFVEWVYENRPGVIVPDGAINGSWFTENRIPMVVRCACCTRTLCVTNALMDDFDRTYCQDCGS